MPDVLMFVLLADLLAAAGVSSSNLTLLSLLYLPGLPSLDPVRLTLRGELLSFLTLGGEFC